jgi:hypothetical protein
MGRVTITHHQGYGDIFTSNSLCNYYSELNDELIIFTSCKHRKKLIDSIYKGNDKIKCIIPSFIEYNGYDTCLECMTYGTSGMCYRDVNQKCKFIDYSPYSDCINIKIGSFKNYSSWEEYVRNSFSFSHAFYGYNGLSDDIRIDKFKINRDYDLENESYNESGLIGKDYIVIHEDVSRGITIDHTKINHGLMYDLNDKSDIMIDQIKILENAKEIHLIDSSYSVMIYFLSFHNDKIKNIPKFLHKHPHNRDFNIYKQPVADNWYFL